MHGVLKAPLLFMMALFIWCFEFATIYPPGALTVALQPYPTTTDIEVSTMNPPPPKDWNPMLVDESKMYPLLALMNRPKGKTTIIVDGEPIQNIIYYSYK